MKYNLTIEQCEINVNRLEIHLEIQSSLAL